MAIRLSEASKYLPNFSRSSIEKVINDGNCGATSENRYFLKKEEVIEKFHDMTKKKQHKQRCCVLDTAFIDAEKLRSLYKGS